MNARIVDDKGRASHSSDHTRETRGSAAPAHSISKQSMTVMPGTGLREFLANHIRSVKKREAAFS